MIYKRSTVNYTSNRTSIYQRTKFKTIIDIPNKMDLYILQKEKKTVNYQRQCSMNMDRENVLNRRLMEIASCKLLIMMLLPSEK